MEAYAKGQEEQATNHTHKGMTVKMRSVHIGSRELT